MKCDVCGREFATQAALNQHMKDKHGEEVSARGSQQPRPEVARKPKAKSLRRRNRHPVAISIIVISVVALLGIYVLVAPSFATPPLPCAKAETYIHIHDYLRISIEGQDVVIPANVGILPSHNCVEPMHTHDASGIIHIELGPSDANNNFTLGQFFKVWNFTYPTVSFNGTSHPVTFSNSNILGFTTDSTHKVVVLVDNKTVTNGVAVPMEQNDYCGPANGNVPPCANTAGGGILWDGGATYPYGPGHTIVIQYVRV